MSTKRCSKCGFFDCECWPSEALSFYQRAAAAQIARGAGNAATARVMASTEQDVRRASTEQAESWKAGEL